MDQITIEVAHTNEISDGFHTFGELYEHRTELWILVCKLLEKEQPGSVWRSWVASDGGTMEGWFILGYRLVAGKQITYHLPAMYWESLGFAEPLSKAPEWDGHTSAAVLKRLQRLR